MTDKKISFPRISIKSINSTVAALRAYFWQRVDVADKDACWPWTGTITRNRYGQLLFREKFQLAHRVSFFLTHGRWPVPACLHSCDNPPCVNPSHLREGTDKENSEDAVKRQRQARGARIHTAKLSEIQVVRIRQLYAKGTNQHDLAKEFGVSQGHISHICKGQTWKYLKSE